MKRRVIRSAGAASGFTLIELLVVIAIIAILAAMLFPVFMSARESARKATCQSNLRQIGIAAQMYTQNFDETMPYSGTGPRGGDLTGLLNPYIKQGAGQGIWRCPSHAAFPPDGSFTTSYGYNWQYLLVEGPDYPHSDWNGFSNSGVHLSFLARPAETLMFVDHSGPAENPILWSYVVRPGDRTDPYNQSGMGRPHFRHQGQANVLFCDGHVKTMGPWIALIPNERTHWDPR
jgi:prepilin-type N-terminal cleavage/methylation domain-containing protein/prepilin-type processing-associated H-X9-DG protein